ncbi:hypothetical protein AAHA92_28979 [Salvia divinorum]|uniref:Endonuclease/exonuclease/phosphatase domain-containing protein n=1 Tax=Salvia divinorum TaxID=28513 RepID=A0ABD1FZC5_SALDI
MVLGSNLQVQTWTSAFRLHHCSPQTTAVWIRVSELPLHLYPSNVISAIGGGVATVIRVDYNTSDLQRGDFARIAVNANLTKPLVSKFTIDGEEFKVEYENLNELCIYCGMYGHLDVNCIRKPKDKDERDLNQGSGIVTEVPKDTYGPWMIVEKRKRQLRCNSENSSKENIMPAGGSRFNILQDANLVHENDRDENLALATMPLAAWDTNVGQGQWTSRKNKEKQVTNRANKSGQVRGESLKNSKPAKSTIGDFIEYKQRQQKEELVTKQSSTLDPSIHTIMHGDMCGSKNSGQGSKRVFEADRPNLEVEQRLTQAFGRPLDRGVREFDDNDVMDLEEIGNPIEGLVDEMEGGQFIDERDERHRMGALERGAKSALFIGALLTLIQLYKPHIIVLLEPRISGKNADNTIRKIGYPNSHRMEAMGFSGVWDGRDMNFMFTAVYGHPSPSRRDILWQQLADIQNASELPWVLLGDFNSISRGLERVGGSANRSGASQQFVRWLTASRLIDHGFLGLSFTWRRGTLHERLDRGLCNSEWRLAYPKASASHLVRYQSDHRPLLLNLCSFSPSITARPFRFIRAWMSHEKYNAFVMDNWGIQRALEYRGVPSLNALEMELREELDKILLREESLWHQKLRNEWVDLGDQNTSFFHLQTIRRRKRNRIEMLQNEEGEWIHNQGQLKSMAMTFYEDLYSEDNLHRPLYVHHNLFPSISQLQAEEIRKQYTIDDVRAAIFEMKPWKALGVDGI